MADGWELRAKKRNAVRASHPNRICYAWTFTVAPARALLPAFWKRFATLPLSRLSCSSGASTPKCSCIRIAPTGCSLAMRDRFWGGRNARVAHNAFTLWEPSANARRQLLQNQPCAITGSVTSTPAVRALSRIHKQFAIRNRGRTVRILWTMRIACGSWRKTRRKFGDAQSRTVCVRARFVRAWFVSEDGSCQRMVRVRAWFVSGRAFRRAAKRSNWIAPLGAVGAAKAVIDCVVVTRCRTGRRSTTQSECCEMGLAAARHRSHLLKDFRQITLKGSQDFVGLILRDVVTKVNRSPAHFTLETWVIAPRLSLPLYIPGRNILLCAPTQVYSCDWRVPQDQIILLLIPIAERTTQPHHKPHPK